MWCHADSPIAPPAKPEAYRREAARLHSKCCPLCRDGWPRMVGQRTGKAFHKLKADAFECHHVEPCNVTAWVVALGLAAAILAVLLYPHSGGWHR